MSGTANKLQVQILSIGRRFAAALLPRLFGTNPRSHHKGATGRFELETNCFQFYAIANLDKTSLQRYTMWTPLSCHEIVDMSTFFHANEGIVPHVRFSHLAIGQCRQADGKQPSQPVTHTMWWWQNIYQARGTRSRCSTGACTARKGSAWQDRVKPVNPWQDLSGGC